MKFFIRSLNYKKFIVFSFAFSLAVAILTSLLTLFSTENFQTESTLFHQNIFIIFCMVVFIGPIIETFIFQFLVIEISIKLTKSILLVVLFSGLVFAASHFSNEKILVDKIIILVSTFCSGIVWALIYIEAKKRKNLSPFLLILGIHIFENLIGFIINFNNFKG
ncbi:CPBP family glutamic-type intramembrane protease [Lacinutrix salivirga]